MTTLGESMAMLKEPKPKLAKVARRVMCILLSHSKRSRLGQRLFLNVKKRAMEKSSLSSRKTKDISQDVCLNCGKEVTGSVTTVWTRQT